MKIVCKRDLQRPLYLAVVVSTPIKVIFIESLINFDFSACRWRYL